MIARHSEAPPPTTPSIPLPDGVFRRFVKARAVTVFSDGSIYSFAKAVRQVDPHANVYDLRNMSVLVGTTQRAFMMLADEIGALPRNAGVQVLYGHRVHVAGGHGAIATALNVEKR